MNLRSIAVIVTVVFTSVSSVGAQTVTPVAPDDDHSVVFELGWAGDWSPDEGVHPTGATFAFEITPLEHSLELEFGVSAIRSHGSTESSIDVLFKKPWPISKQFEFMAGVGPELIHATGTDGGTFWGVSGVLDFMFWPTKNVGWYLEPGYEATFHDGTTQHGLAMAAGVIIGR
jgi:hypothetical protein